MSEIFKDPNPVGYIQHHLQHLTIGLVNVDTVAISFILGAGAIVFAWSVGRNFSADTPTGVQNFLEALVEFVNDQVSSLYPRRDPLVGPMALTIFVWVFLMNAMDLIPIDLLPLAAQVIGKYVFGVPPHEVGFRAVPTAGLATPFAMAISVFVLTIFYGIRSKGLGSWLKGFVTHPFGIWLAPFNIVMSVVEELAKPLSLALRLFGNMFAGELIFMLIALVGFAWFMIPAQIALGFVWTTFHLLIITIQAFIFMLLSVVYLALATSHDEH